MHLQIGIDLNDLFINSDEEIISYLFDPNNNQSVEYINRIDINSLFPEISQMILQYKIFLKEKSFDSALNVLIHSDTLLNMKKPVKQIITNVLSVMISDSNEKISNTYQEYLQNIHIKKFIDEIQKIIKKIINSESDLLIYLFNIISFLFMKQNNWREIDEIIDMIEPKNYNIDYYVFQYYKGLIKISQNNWIGLMV